MPGMAPPPDRRLTHDHEGRNLVYHVVEPARLEGGAMAAFMPARIARGAIEDAISQKKGNTPPTAPESGCAVTEHYEQSDPECRVAQRRPIGAPHELLHCPARNIGMVPFGRRETIGHSHLRIVADQAVVALYRPSGLRMMDLVHRGSVHAGQFGTSNPRSGRKIFERSSFCSRRLGHSPVTRFSGRPCGLPLRLHHPCGQPHAQAAGPWQNSAPRWERSGLPCGRPLWPTPDFSKSYAPCQERFARLCERSPAAFLRPSKRNLVRVFRYSYQLSSGISLFGSGVALGLRASGSDELAFSA